MQPTFSLIFSNRSRIPINETYQSGGAYLCHLSVVQIEYLQGLLLSQEHKTQNDNLIHVSPYGRQRRWDRKTLWPGNHGYDSSRRKQIQ